MDDQNKITAIMEWAGDHPNFDTSFIENLQEQINFRGSLTQA